MTDFTRSLVDNVRKVIIGKSGAIELLMVALLAEGHVLIEDVPGLGKTLMAKAMAKSMGGVFRRVQFTADLLPADITGFNIYNRQTGEFNFQPGPVMANILLADEINRTIPRTQAALLEAMEERQVTVDGNTIALPRPFMVIATQNPIELEGTFPLPEAQLDRFALKITLGYPQQDEEVAILGRFQHEDPFDRLAAVTAPDQIIAGQQTRRAVRVSAPVRGYISALVQATRTHAAFRYGASPRGSIVLMRAAQALAMMRGRGFVLPDDVKALAGPVLAHRLILREEERIRGEAAPRFLTEIIERLPVPAPAE